MKVLGLTGGIGMGKSSAGQWLQTHDVPVVDSDVLARAVVEPGQPALNEIARAFGPDVIGPDGRLRRSTLAEIVFADRAARQQLESITHPRIRESWLGYLASLRAQMRPLAVVIVPLLFEIGVEKEMNATLCVACSAPTQRGRLADRGWDSNQTDQRIAAQWAIERKMARADFVVWTEGDRSLTGEQLQRILDSLGS
jgi:dephospho-CoA kinase